MQSDYAGWTDKMKSTLNGLNQIGANGCNPFRVENGLEWLTQGSSFLATLGWMMESRWDS
jgi:hypothetical protein